MNKTELIAEVAAKCAISKKDAEKTVNATFDTIAEALCKGDKVQLVGFGGFETKHREAHMGRVIFRRDDKAGGIPVDAVDDTRPQFAVDAGKALPAVVEQRIDQRTVRVSRCWVYHQPLGLIDNNDVRVLVYHLQRDVLRNHIYRLRRGPGNGHGLAAGQPGILRQRAALRGDSPLLRQALKGGAAQPRLFRQPRIQTLSRILSRCL